MGDGRAWSPEPGARSPVFGKRRVYRHEQLHRAGGARGLVRNAAMAFYSACVYI